VKRRNARKLWAMQNWLHARAIANGMCNRSPLGHSFRGAYRCLMNRLAVEFDRTPISERLPIYNNRSNGGAE
jgi:hypothetical protein